jgi:hypothetical protein
MTSGPLKRNIGIVLFLTEASHLASEIWHEVQIRQVQKETYLNLSLQGDALFIADPLALRDL